ncbi:MAG: hypothetical protein ACLFNN_02460 [Candidatus Paceibacterota bacterium]
MTDCIRESYLRGPDNGINSNSSAGSKIVRWTSASALQRYQKIFHQQESLRRNSFLFVVPLIRGGGKEETNVVKINYSLRCKYRQIFKSRTPQEVLDFLVNYFWAGKIYFINNYFDLKGIKEFKKYEAFAPDSFVESWSFIKQVQLPRNDRHHIVPTTRVKGLADNIAKVSLHLHRKFHNLFINRTPYEILDLLVNYFWGGNVLFLKEFLFKQRENFLDPLN